MRKTIVALGLGILMLLGVTYVYAQSTAPGPGPGPGAGQEYGKWSGRWSSLTPDQKTKLQELRRRFNDETAQLKGAIYTKRLELRSLWTDPKADPKAILGKEKELTSLKDQLRDKAVHFKLEARSVLTPEQLAQFGSRWGMGGFGHRHMMGHGYGMGPGGMGRGMGPGSGMGSGFGCY